MRKLILISIFMFTGCATTQPATSSGNYLQNGKADQAKLAGDAVTQLQALWPAAKTQFELQQPSTDVFGYSLVAKLRESGYAVMEYTPAVKDVKQVEKTEVATKPLSTKSLTLSYVLDRAGANNLYRLIFIVGNQTMSRAYLEQDGVLVPAGSWSLRKE